MKNNIRFYCCAEYIDNIGSLDDCYECAGSDDFKFCPYCGYRLSFNE
jgi:hypothetical protein